jgi:hypothetical protein
MDMVFCDGECRIRTEHAPANFTTIKHVAINLTRTAPGKDSLRLKRMVAAWDDDFLASLITAWFLHPIPLQRDDVTLDNVCPFFHTLGVCGNIRRAPVPLCGQAVRGRKL